MPNTIDNTKFINMIKNPPSLASLPTLNKRLLAGNRAFTILAAGGVFLTLYFITYKTSMNMFAGSYFSTKKDFAFECDPYLQKVRCQYGNVYNRHEWY